MAQEKDDSIKLRLSFFDPFQANVPFLYPLKTSGNLFFWRFQGIERKHWPEMG